MTQWLSTEIARIQTLVLLGAVLAVIAVTVMTFYKTRAAIPALVTLVSGGVILWGLNNTSWFQQKTGQETATAVAVVHQGLNVVAQRHAIVVPTPDGSHIRVQW